MVTPRLKWTTRSLEAIRVEIRTDFTDPETKGLVFRVTPAGHKSWALLYNRKGDGKKRRVTLGSSQSSGWQMPEQRQGNSGPRSAMVMILLEMRRSIGRLTPFQT